jgi:hypothetical protein
MGPTSKNSYEHAHVRASSEAHTQQGNSNNTNDYECYPASPMLDPLLPCPVLPNQLRSYGLLELG